MLSAQVILWEDLEGAHVAAALEQVKSRLRGTQDTTVPWQ